MAVDTVNREGELKPGTVLGGRTADVPTGPPGQ